MRLLGRLLRPAASIGLKLFAVSLVQIGNLWNKWIVCHKKIRRLPQRNGKEKEQD